jgi:hypothetical protein
VVGRFMGVDPVGFMENNLHSFNRYAYGNNNPSRYLDPDGNLPVLIPLAAYVFGNAAIGAGFDYAFQKAMGHTVNWGQVAFGGFVGGMLGGAGGVGASAVMNSTKATASVWSMNPFVRGNIIEKSLGGWGDNTRVIDAFSKGVATSIKSLDLNAKTYQSASALRSTLKGYIDDVAGFLRSGKLLENGHRISAEEIAERRLLTAVPDAGNAMQQGVLKEMAEYAASKNVTFDLVIFP